jgi:hypothetical protein
VWFVRNPRLANKVVSNKYVFCILMFRGGILKAVIFKYSLFTIAFNDSKNVLSF